LANTISYPNIQNYISNAFYSYANGAAYVSGITANDILNTALVTLINNTNTDITSAFSLEQLSPAISYLTTTILDSDPLLSTAADIVANIVDGNIVSTPILDFSQLVNINNNQNITSLVYTPLPDVITSNSSSDTYAKSTHGSTVDVSPSLTQPSDITFNYKGFEPTHRFAGQYPFVHTHKTESGHVMEHDDTPGGERILQYHMSGTYDEMRHDGSRIAKTSNDNLVVVDGDNKLWVEGSGDVYVRGNIKVICLNDVHMEVAGRFELNATEEVRIKGKSIQLEAYNGNTNIYTSGSLNSFTGVDTNILTKGGTYITAQKEFDVLTQGKANIQALQDINIKTDALAYMTALSGMNLLTNGVANFTSQDDMNILTNGTGYFSGSGDINLNAGGDLNEQAAGAVNIDGSSVNLDGGGSAGSASSASPAGTAVKAQMAIKSGLDTGYSRDQSASVESVVEELLQGSCDDPEQFRKNVSAAVANGKITQDQANKILDPSNTPQAASAADTTAANAKINPRSTSADDIAALPDSSIGPGLRLSEHFTLADLTVKATFSHELVPNQGLSKAKLASNLALVARNCLEPINARWGPIGVNSAFRPESGKSQHNTGHAIDVTYGLRSQDPQTVYQIAQWIRDNVLFDQLILEYGRTQIWTHISYDASKRQQRRDIRTCPHPSASEYPSGLIVYNWKPGAAGNG